MRQILFVSLLLLTACAPRSALIPGPLSDAATVRSIYVKTLREIDPNTGDFSTKRAVAPSFRRIDVAIPPAHKPGQVEWPRGTPDPARHMLVTEQAAFSSESNFTDAMRAALRQRAPADREVVLYIHGFNNTFADGVLRMAQMTHDLNLDGVPAHFSWASAALPLGYAYDRDSVIAARDGLETMLRSIQRAGADRIVLIAHSMGAYLTMEALRQLAISNNQGLLDRIETVVLISPDIDVEVFKAQARRIGDLPQPFVVLTSKRDRALRVSAGLTGQENRLGTLADPEVLGDLDLLLLDVSQLARGGDRLGHFTAATSPAAISVLQNLNQIDRALTEDIATQPGLLQGTVLGVRRATRVVLPRPN